MKILLVGAGGYGTGYVKELLKAHNKTLVFEGIVEPYFDNCKMKSEILSANIPVYSCMSEFYDRHTADLAIISTPTFLHKDHSICALSNGSYVLCEKPVAPTTEDARAMIEAEQQYGKWIAIGYQWSFSDAMQKLKSDIIDGVLGDPVSFKTAISWPRKRDYYQRGGGWGGKISRDGKLILDSIASNACAHYLHNMLFVLGNSMETSANVEDFQAECFRANDIENFDTCCIKLKAKNVPLYFIASHAADGHKNPIFTYVFENATVIYSQEDGSQIIARFNDGTEKIYGDPFENGAKKMLDCIAAATNGTRPICTVQTAIPHAAFIEELYKTTPINDFKEDLIDINETTNSVSVKGLFKAIYESYDKEAMLSQIYNV